MITSIQLYINLYISYLLAEAVATFLNESCTTDGVNPSDPLLFTCTVYAAVLLRVVLPNGDQEIVSLGDTADDVVIGNPPDDITAAAVFLDIEELDESKRNFNLTLHIVNASLLDGREIKCDDSTSKNQAMARCPIGKFGSPSNHSLLCYVSSVVATSK